MYILGFRGYPLFVSCTVYEKKFGSGVNGRKAVDNSFKSWKDLGLRNVEVLGFN